MGVGVRTGKREKWEEGEGEKREEEVVNRKLLFPW